jgi:hypothetical protein
MDMDQLVITLEVLLKWLKWDLKSEQELTDLTPLVTRRLPLEKALLLDLLL